MNKSFRFRITMTLSCLIMAILPLLIATGFYYQLSRSTLISSQLDTLTTSLSLASTFYDMTCEKMISNHTLNSALESMVSTIPLSNMDTEFCHAVQKEKARIFMNWKRNVDQYIHRFSSQSSLLSGDLSVYLYFPEHHLFWCSDTSYTENVTPVSVNQLYKFQNLSEIESYWLPSQKLSYYNFSGEKWITLTDRYISYIHPIKNESGNIQAIEIFNIDGEIFEQISYKEKYNLQGGFLIFQRNGTLLYWSNSLNDKILSASAQEISILHKNINELKQNKLTFLNQPYLAESATVGSDFIFIHITPYDQIIQKLRTDSRTIIAVFLGIAVCFASIAFYTANKLYQPFRTLSTNMALVAKGNLSNRIISNRTDEYGEVYQGFNDMLDQINMLLNNLTNEKLLRAETEIFLLQEQINPHFIYNTLEIVYSLAKLNRTQEIPPVIKALSDFFRMCLSDGAADVPLSTALQICDNYILIQNVRFANKIHYTVDIPKHLCSYIIPKYAVQVLVENAVVHGIEPLSRKGSILVSAKTEDTKIVISVSDDGVGIPDAKLCQLEQEFQKNTIKKENFALCNLNRQIIIKYGPSYGVHLLSDQLHGTCVEIVMPYITEKEKNDV